MRLGRRVLAVVSVVCSHGVAFGQAPETLPEALPAEQATWLFRVYDATVTSVVRVECGDAVGSGFFFHSPTHLATAFHVIQSGRDVQLVFADGSVATAEVVAWDAGLDLALLELEGGRAGQPLAPAEPPRVGDPVAAIGVPMDAIVRQAHASALPLFTLTQGAVSGVTPAAIQTDAAINPGNSGGPLLDRKGRVVGLVSRKVSDAEGLAFAVPTGRLLELAKQIGREGPFLGTVSAAIEIGYGASEHELGGLVLGLRVLVFDRFGLALRGAWMSDERVLTNGWFTEERDRTLFEAAAFYRFSFYAPPYLALHLPIGAGLAVTWDDLDRTTLTAQLADPNCDSSTNQCGFETSAERITVKDQRVRPMASVELELSPLLLSSAFYFEGVRVSGGRVGIGLVF